MADNNSMKSLGYALRKAPSETKAALFVKQGKSTYLLDVAVNVIEAENFMYLSAKPIVGVFKFSGKDAVHASDADAKMAREQLVPAGGNKGKAGKSTDPAVIEAQKKIANIMKGLPEGYKLAGMSDDGTPKIVKARQKKA